MMPDSITFSQEVFDEICEQIADGKSLRDICKSDNMPNKSTVFRWLAQDEKLRDQYALAREEQGESHADEIVAIADKATPEDVQVAKLRIDARKWTASKLTPKKYGDKLDLNHSGGVKIEAVRREFVDGGEK